MKMLISNNRGSNKLLEIMRQKKKLEIFLPHKCFLEIDFLFHKQILNFNKTNNNSNSNRFNNNNNSNSNNNNNRNNNSNNKIIKLKT